MYYTPYRYTMWTPIKVKVFLCIWFIYLYSAGFTIVLKHRAKKKFTMDFCLVCSAWNEGQLKKFGASKKLESLVQMA
jgi:hypothetical protein